MNIKLLKKSTNTSTYTPDMRKMYIWSLAILYYDTRVSILTANNGHPSTTVQTIIAGPERHEEDNLRVWSPASAPRHWQTDRRFSLESYSAAVPIVWRPWRATVTGSKEKKRKQEKARLPEKVGTCCIYRVQLFFPTLCDYPLLVGWPSGLRTGTGAALCSSVIQQPDHTETMEAEIRVKVKFMKWKT